MSSGQGSQVESENRPEKGQGSTRDVKKKLTLMKQFRVFLLQDDTKREGVGWLTAAIEDGSLLFRLDSAIVESIWRVARRLTIPKPPMKLWESASSSILNTVYCSR